MRRITLFFLGYIFAFMLILAPQASAAQTCYVVDESQNRNSIHFNSDTAIDWISGHTSNIKGTICLDSSLQLDKKHPVTADFVVDLKTMRTGIAFRDKHLQEDFLETNLYPLAKFHVTGVESNATPPYANGQTISLVASGDFYIHGVTHPKNIPVKVTYFSDKSSGSSIRIEARFPIRLESYNIDRPEIMFQKLAEVVIVTVDAYATTARRPSP